MQNIDHWKKFLNILLFAAGAVLIGAYIAFWLGFDIFQLPLHEVNTSPLADMIISLVLCFFNMFFVFGYVLQIPPTNLLKVTGCYMIMAIIPSLFGHSPIFAQTLVPLVVVLGYSDIHKKGKANALFRFFKIAFYVTVFQLLSKALKFYSLDFSFNYDFIPTTTKIFYQIDQLILLFLFYLQGGIPYEKQLALVLHVFPHRLCVPASPDEEDLSLLEEFNHLPRVQKLRAMLFIFLFQLFQLILILWICKIGDVFLECILIMISFWLSNIVIKRRWHSNTLWLCTMGAAIVFYVCARAVIPVYLSLFSSIIIGSLISYSLYWVGEHIEKFNKMKFIRVDFPFLTKQEKRIAVEILDGKSVEEIAEMFKDTESLNSIKVSVRSIKSKLKEEIDKEA